MDNPIYELLPLKPTSVYEQIYHMRHITVRLKMKIILACLNDQRDLELNGIDPNTRNDKILAAAKSLDKIIAKSEKNQTLP
jgi:hypothetical protein